MNEASQDQLSNMQSCKSFVRWELHVRRWKLSDDARYQKQLRRRGLNENADRNACSCLESWEDGYQLIFNQDK